VIHYSYGTKFLLSISKKVHSPTILLAISVGVDDLMIYHTFLCSIASDKSATTATKTQHNHFAVL
jgi:hypothetical protein